MRTFSFANFAKVATAFFQSTCSSTSTAMTGEKVSDKEEFSMSSTAVTYRRVFTLRSRSLSKSRYVGLMSVKVVAKGSKKDGEINWNICPVPAPMNKIE